MTPSARPTVLLVHAGDIEVEARAQILRDSGFAVNTVDGQGDNAEVTILAAIHTEPPHCLVLPFDPEEGGAALRAIKADHFYGNLPSVLLLDPAHRAGIDWASLGADDYVLTPVDDEELVERIRLCLARAQRDLNANPLTGLPGNLTITREAERRLDNNIQFAIAYLDLDFFKSYNDKYGFGRGDEILRMTARVIVNAVRELNHPDTYVGHVGGDDFIFITPPQLIEQACQQVCARFDLLVPNFYDDDDRAAGEIQSIDRKGTPQTFPLMTCSIGVIDTSLRPVTHMGEIGSRSAELKKASKAQTGSTYLIDRRKA